MVTLDRLPAPDPPAVRVADTRGRELLRVPLEAPCEWRDITATLAKPSNTLTVTVHLASGDDVAAAPSPTAALAGPERPPSTDSDSDSMFSAYSKQLGDAGDAPGADSAGEQQDAAAPAVLAAPAAPVPPTPSQSAEAEAPCEEESKAEPLAGDTVEGDASAAKKKKKKKKAGGRACK
jgi:hypothetical protein